MTYTTIPNPIPTNTIFSLYYINNSYYPNIQPPETIYNLVKHNNTNTIYSSFNANTTITTSTLSEPYFFTRDSQDNIYYTTYAYDVSGLKQVYLLNKNGTSSTNPTVLINQSIGNFNSPRGISIGTNDNELWVADVSDKCVFKKFIYSSSIWSLNLIYTPTNTTIPTNLSDKIQGIKYKSGYIYACDNGLSGAIYSIDVSHSITPHFTIYTNINTDSPQDLTFDTSGNLYYINSYTDTYGSLVVFNGSTSTVLISSSYLETLYSLYSGIFQNLYSLSFDNDYKKIYITGLDTNSIMYYDLDVSGTLFKFITDDVPASTGNSGLKQPSGIILDSENNVYVNNFNTDGNDGYIQKIQGIQYNFTNISGLAGGTYPVDIYNSTSSTVVSSSTFSINVQCFLKGTKILCKIDEIETWIKIEDLMPNYLVKTFKYGYIPIKNIGCCEMTNSIQLNPNKLFKMSKEFNSELIEDLYVSGKHSRLVDNLTIEQKEKTLKLWSKLLKIDEKYLLMAYIDDLFIDVKDENKYLMYQIILQSESITQQYGIFANGILTESMSISTFETKKQLTQLF